MPIHAFTSALSVKRGDALINTHVQKKWVWAWVLNGYTTAVSGDMIKLKTAKYAAFGFREPGLPGFSVSDG
ncbi:hypothetical protein [Pseudomonas palleroniana]|uniref:hypothetical protein n=1 Tax=Pseudomonas palleroniana TaxID=191390 RepID=UPI001FD1A396|nr:hypothetical protein [Pseudomonas palleroniana]UOP13912.1 hypothetical protein LDL65_18610 [Pseudomonas palleroniana]